MHMLNLSSMTQVQQNNWEKEVSNRFFFFFFTSSRNESCKVEDGMSLFHMCTILICLPYEELLMYFFFYFSPCYLREAIMQDTQSLWILWNMTSIFCQVGLSTQKSLHSLVSSISLKQNQTIMWFQTFDIIKQQNILKDRQKQTEIFPQILAGLSFA